MGQSGPDGTNSHRFFFEVGVGRVGASLRRILNGFRQILSGLRGYDGLGIKTVKDRFGRFFYSK
jgi:hypothetical protein